MFSIFVSVDSVHIQIHVYCKYYFSQIRKAVFYETGLCLDVD